MLNVTYHYCISPATSKGGFPVTRVICHESVIYVTGHVSHRSEAQGLLPRITRLRNIFPSLPSRELYFTQGSGGCALTFAGIMFLCIGFSQRYML